MPTTLSAVYGEHSEICGCDCAISYRFPLWLARSSAVGSRGNNTLGGLFVAHSWGEPAQEGGQTRKKLFIWQAAQRPNCPKPVDEKDTYNMKKFVSSHRRSYSFSVLFQPSKMGRTLVSFFQFFFSCFIFLCKRTSCIWTPRTWKGRRNWKSQRLFGWCDLEEHLSDNPAREYREHRWQSMKIMKKANRLREMFAFGMHGSVIPSTYWKTRGAPLLRKPRSHFFKIGVPEIGVVQNRVTWEELQNQRVTQKKVIYHPFLVNSYQKFKKPPDQRVFLSPTNIFIRIVILH